MTTETATQHTILTVWYDATEDGAWILSRDTYTGDDPDVGSDHTDTLETYETEQEALEAGRAKAARLDLPLYTMDAHGRHTRD